MTLVWRPRPPDAEFKIRTRLDFTSAFLICENAEQWNEELGLPSAVADGRKPQHDPFNQAKKNLLTEGSIGQPLISRFAPTMGQAARLTVATPTRSPSPDGLFHAQSLSLW